MTLPATLNNAACVVLGGGGFLGAQLCPRLVKLGARVRAYGKSRYFDEPLRQVHWQTGRLDDIPKLASLVEGADIVFHLAGATTPASAEASRIDDVTVNVIGSINLLDLCRNAGVGRVVFASSGGTVYGEAGAPPYREDAPTRPISTYGINKLAVEHYLMLYNRLYGMRNVILRVANPFGPYQQGLKNQGVIPVFARKALTREAIKIWGDGSVTRDYLYGGDAADAMIAAALYRGQEPVFNVGSNKGRSLRDVVASLETVLGRSIDVEYQAARRFDAAVNVLDCSLAKRELGWTAGTGWEAALKTTCDWIAADIARDGTER